MGHVKILIGLLVDRALRRLRIIPRTTLRKRTQVYDAVYLQHGGVYKEKEARKGRRNVQIRATEK